MARYCSTMMIFTALISFGLISLPTEMMAQEKSLKEQIVGTWSLVSVDDVQSNGTRTPLYGPSPRGIAVFDSGGHYVLELTNPSVPKFASNNRTTGTAEENKAAVLGVLAHFGTYTVNESDRSFTLRIESSSFPNWSGVEQKRGPVIIEGDNLKWANPTSSGGGSSELVWKRLK